tara:strand:+ start:3161 stop:3634 length:474 start_codon:yes stop_codon:yes gene_type:complete
LKNLKNFIKNVKTTKSFATFIGHLGLIPFIFITLGVWFFPVEYKPDFESAFLLYLSLIISFLASIYWGIAVKDKKNNNSHIKLTLSVLPLVLIFIINILKLSIIIKLLVYFLMLNSILILEYVFYKFTEIPKWYLSLRARLNISLNIIIILFILSYS